MKNNSSSERSSTLKTFFKGFPQSNQFVAGFTAGGVSVLLLHPLDLLKTRFQATTTSEFQSFLSIPRQLYLIFKDFGIRGLYRGLTANFAGSTLSWGAYFLLYDKFQSNWNRRHDTLNGWQYFLSSLLAGSLTVFIANPIWVAKTRLCQPPSFATAVQPKGLFNCLKLTYNLEGLRGLYRGLGIGLLSTSHGAVQFLVYEKIKSFQRRSTDQAPPTIPVYLTMSSISKATASLITYPLQVIRCRLQLSPQPDGRYRFFNLMDVAQTTWRNEGWRGFYKGITPNIVRVLPGTCVTFLVYEKLMETLKGINES